MSIRCNLVLLPLTLFVCSCWNEPIDFGAEPMPKVPLPVTPYEISRYSDQIPTQLISVKGYLTIEGPGASRIYSDSTQALLRNKASSFVVFFLEGKSQQLAEKSCKDGYVSVVGYFDQDIGYFMALYVHQYEVLGEAAGGKLCFETEYDWRADQELKKLFPEDYSVTLEF